MTYRRLTSQSPLFPSENELDSSNNSSIGQNTANDEMDSSFANSPNHSSSVISSDSNPFKTPYVGRSANSSKGADLDDTNPFGGYPVHAFPIHLDEVEDDDELHNPDPIKDAEYDKNRFWYDLKNMDRKSGLGLASFFILIAGLILLFVLLPVLTFTNKIDPAPAAHATNTSSLSKYQYPTLNAIRSSLVDPDTPSSAKSISAIDGSTWKLVFSDEFNAEGRTFYDGDDQFWTAPDIHYYATKDLEWYDPDASTTANGTLQLTMDAFKNHDLFYRSGMLQSWNKLCFTQGYVEVSVNLPNYGNVSGLWPGMWTLGNLARPGFGASSEGVWPYSYEACDAGITANQSSPDGINYLPGQKLSVCTCDNEDHPNQGTGRGAPEIDIIEIEADTTLKVGLASQSMQIAPFDIWYMPDYDFIEIYNQSTTTVNTYAGGPFQQAVSAVSTLNTSWYEFGTDAGHYQKYSIEYLNDDSTGYCSWKVGDAKTFTIYANALHPNGNIDWRRISKEPMSIIMNFGISNNWAYIDWQSLHFPAKMSIDYVRIYQPEDQINLTCDPEDYPTTDYINNHKPAYYNQNYTSWKEAGYEFPKNILTGNCKSSKFKLSN